MDLNRRNYENRTRIGGLNGQESVDGLTDMRLR